MPNCYSVDFLTRVRIYSHKYKFEYFNGGIVMEEKKDLELSGKKIEEEQMGEIVGGLDVYECPSESATVAKGESGGNDRGERVRHPRVIHLSR